MIPRLSNKTLDGLPVSIARPRYRRSEIATGIMHLGIGGFHRAHQAVYVDDCLAAGEVAWGIGAVSLRRPDTRDALKPQDWLYAVAARDNDAEELRVIGAIRNIFVAPEEPEAVIAAMADPATKIVSLTITEKGYTANLVTRDLLMDHPDIVHDLKGDGAPRSALGYIVAALERRRKAKLAPFTLLCCDNLPSNGRTLHKLLTQFAAARDAGLGRYVESEVLCPSSMVDRIVPVTTDADRSAIAEGLGLEDAWPVITEGFSQWVVEDRFALGRPQWERSGVEFVNDVTPFERMKLRLLNGSHSILAALGRPAGLATVSDAIRQPIIKRFVEAYWSEAAPTLGRALDTGGYRAKLIRRYENTRLVHKLAQIATDASQKIPQRILPPLKERITAGDAVPAMVFAIAAWIHSCRGTDEDGRPMPVTDPVFERWRSRPDQAAASAAETVDAYFGFAEFFGMEMPALPGLRDGLIRSLGEIRSKGVLAAAERMMGT